MINEEKALGLISQIDTILANPKGVEDIFENVPGARVKFSFEGTVKVTNSDLGKEWLIIRRNGSASISLHTSEENLDLLTVVQQRTGGDKDSGADMFLDMPTENPNTVVGYNYSEPNGEGRWRDNGERKVDDSRDVKVLYNQRTEVRNRGDLPPLVDIQATMQGMIDGFKKGSFDYTGMVVRRG